VPGQHLLGRRPDAGRVGRVELDRVQAEARYPLERSRPAAAAMTVLPLARSSSASARPMPLVAPGMKMVFPEMFMSQSGGRARPGRERLSGIGDPWFGLGRADSVNGMDRPALADFLRHRREELPTRGRRAARRGAAADPGCAARVAALAAMSVDYYTRLEQQRGPQPSEQMLAALAGRSG